jgi:hypothetical protein
VLPEGLEMLRRGGTYVESGNFVETGNVSIDVHRHIAAMRMMRKYSNIFPFEKLVTHAYGIEDGDAAMKKSFEPGALRVVFKP